MMRMHAKKMMRHAYDDAYACQEADANVLPLSLSGLATSVIETSVTGLAFQLDAVVHVC